MLHQFKFNSKLWQVCLDEPLPIVLNQLTLSSQLMMKFSRQLTLQVAIVVMDGVAIHCFMKIASAKSFKLKI